MSELESLPNIGPELARALRAAGIADSDALRQIGAIKAWWRIHPRFTCLHSLLALEGAVQGIPKRQLDETTRRHLKEATQP